MLTHYAKLIEFMNYIGSSLSDSAPVFSTSLIPRKIGTPEQLAELKKVIGCQGQCSLLPGQQFYTNTGNTKILMTHSTMKCPSSKIKIATLQMRSLISSEDTTEIPTKKILPSQDSKRIKLTVQIAQGVSLTKLSMERSMRNYSTTTN